MTTAGVAALGSDSRCVAVVPVFNEEATVVSVLDRVYPMVDAVIVVDDGSTDGTARLLEQWGRGRDRAILITLPENRGVSAAYRAAMVALAGRVDSGVLRRDDLVVFVDADGQHDLGELNRLLGVVRTESLDALIAQRDLSYQRPFKRIGNHVMSVWASIWAGRRLRDVESGYRVVRVGPLLAAMRFVHGFRYSQPSQLAVVMSRLGFRLRNDVEVTVPVARSRTRLSSAMIHAVAIPWSALRVMVGPLGRARRATSPRPRSGHREPQLGRVVIVADAFVAAAAALRIVSRTNASFATISIALAIVAFLVVSRRAAGPISRGVAFVIAPAQLFLAGFLWGPSSLTCLAALGTGITAGLLLSPEQRWSRSAASRAVVTTGGWVRGVALVALVAVFWMGAVVWSGANNPAAAWFGRTASHGRRSADTVAITFDDGPNDTSTLALAQLLNDRGAKGTFFMVGAAAEARPVLVQQVAAMGHVIGNHSYRHGPSDWLTRGYPELLRGERSFQKVLGRCPAFFRPPYGRHTPDMAETVEGLKMHMVTWDVSASDWQTRDPRLVAQRVLRHVRRGSIILLHDGSNGRPAADRSFIVAAVGFVLDGLTSRHLLPVGLDTLLGKSAWLPACP